MFEVGGVYGINELPDSALVKVPGYCWHPGEDAIVGSVGKIKELLPGLDVQVVLMSPKG